MPRTRRDEGPGIALYNTDEAGRLKLPQHFLDLLPADDVFVYAWLAPCLRLSGRETMLSTAEELFGHFSDPIQIEFLRRRILGTARKLAIDNAGRVRLPRLHLTFIGVDAGDRVMVVPVDWQKAILEIWHPDKFRQQVLDEQLYERLKQMVFEQV